MNIGSIKAAHAYYRDKGPLSRFSIQKSHGKFYMKKKRYLESQFNRIRSTENNCQC